MIDSFGRTQQPPRSLARVLGDALTADTTNPSPDVSTAPVVGAGAGAAVGAFAGMFLKHPLIGALVGAGLGTVVGVAYNARSSATAAAKTTPPGTSSSLPAFDPASTDASHAFIVGVYAKGVLAKLPAPGQTVKDYVASVDVDHLLVAGPFSLDQKPPIGILDPVPDLVIAAMMSGVIDDYATKGEIEALKKLNP